MRTHLYILVTLLLAFGCSEQDTFKYEKGLSAYLSNIFDEELKEINEDTLVFLYLEYCRSCVRDALIFLDSIQNPGDNSKIYLIGDPNFYPEHEDIIKRIKGKFIFETDKNSNHYSYVTGIGEPLILKLNNGEIISHSYMNLETLEHLESRFFD